MVSRELIRRYPFFAGLSIDQLDALTRLADEQSVEAGHVFFRENELLDRFYILLEGTVSVFMEVPDSTQHQPLAGQLTGRVKSREITVSTVAAGEVFGFSALVPPPLATAGVRAATACRVVAFDAKRLSEAFEADCRLGYLISQRAAAIMRMRLRDLHIETVALQEASGD